MRCFIKKKISVINLNRLKKSQIKEYLSRNKSLLLFCLSLIWLSTLAWIGFLGHLGSMGIIDKTEAIYTEVARQIVQTQDWITPDWNGKIFFDYPIGGYWLIALSMTVFGLQPWAIRLPGALMAIALVVFGFYTLRYFGMTHRLKASSQQQLTLTAWIGAGILALNPGWVAWGRAAVTDIFLASSISMAMLAFFWSYAQSNNPRTRQQGYCLFPFLMAIAVLAKGLIGLVLPVLGIGSFLLYLGKIQEVWREMRPLRAAVIFLTVAAPWYVIATWVNGRPFLETFFGMSHFQRATTVVYGHAGAWYFYLPWLFIFLLPWSIYLPLAIVRLQFWQRKEWQQAPRSHHLGLFTVFWLATFFLFFSLVVTKLPGYILPAIPAGVILVTLFWAEQMQAADNRPTWGLGISVFTNLLVLLALAIAGWLSPQLVGKDPTVPGFRSALQASGLPLRTAIIWGTATLLGINLLPSARQWRWLWLPNLFGLMGFISFVGFPAIGLIDTLAATSPTRTCRQGESRGSTE
jgi:4-amino-4-deoxy-L-arabinose transferase-like glycosyltransferase